MATAQLKKFARKARVQLENAEVDKELLVDLYRNYANVGNTAHFINQALKQFPQLNCGIASLYLKYHLGKGVVIQGRYESHNHTFLLVDKKTVIDITADQYGGPSVYVGELQKPWGILNRIAR